MLPSNAPPNSGVWDSLVSKKKSELHDGAVAVGGRWQSSSMCMNNESAAAGMHA